MTAIEIVVDTRGNPVVPEARHVDLAGFDIRRDDGFSRTCPQPGPLQGSRDRQQEREGTLHDSSKRQSHVLAILPVDSLRMDQCIDSRLLQHRSAQRRQLRLGSQMIDISLDHFLEFRLSLSAPTLPEIS
jgi:hypothetical protein